jgi:hypothetical protein
LILKIKNKAFLQKTYVFGSGFILANVLARTKCTMAISFFPKLCQFLDFNVGFRYA